MKLKKILGITGLAVASTVALTACGAGGNKSAKDDKTLTVGIMTLDECGIKSKNWLKTRVSLSS